MEHINSNTYWNERFKTDWSSSDGPNQSRFFSKIAIENSPDWLIDQIRKNELTLADWGCAEGDGTDVWANYINPTQIFGIDFSKIAIVKAAQQYPVIHFLNEDWLNHDNSEQFGTFDIVFSSNTLEHLHQPFEALNILSNHANKAVILLIPYREHKRITEHFSTFLPNNIPLVLKTGFKLIWSRVIACGAIQDTYWRGDQILLVYAEPIWFDSLKPVLKDCWIEHEDKESLIAPLNQIINDKDAQLIDLNKKRDSDREQIASLIYKISKCDEEINNLNYLVMEQNRKINDFNQIILEKNLSIDTLGNEASATRAELTTVLAVLDKIRSSHSWHITAPLRFIRRWMRYGLLADDRKWIEKRLRYIFQKLPISNAIKIAIRNKYVQLFGSPLQDRSFQSFFEKSLPEDKHILSKAEKLNEAYNFVIPQSWPYKHKPYGVLFLPIIDWHFRIQRPQQIARKFASRGHSIAYLNLTFGSEFSITAIEKGIDSLQLPGDKNTNVYKTIPTRNDVDRVVKLLLGYISNSGTNQWVCIVQLPYWQKIALQLQQAGNYIIYDCLDYHAGFSTNEKQMLDEENQLIQHSDLVITSSEVLLKKIQNRNSSSILIRNGVDYPHFATIPESKHSTISELKIGYFGAIADWFDTALVAEIALLRPTWQFFLIGSTFSADIAPFETCQNISLYGEKPYQELPTLISDWDCCIIPFKHLPLTEATNPVKLYEMLATGKPIVSVTLPELIPISDAGHIALADNATTFLAKIETEVISDNSFKQEARRRLASENTWEIRQFQFDQAIRNIYPLVTIVIVTYNNLELNRLCLESVLNDTDYPNFEVIVIDNASLDGTSQYLENLTHPKLNKILNKENRGYAIANNQGIKLAQGKFICLLNNDTVVTGSWLSTLVRHIQNNPGIGLIGPVTNAIDNEAKIAVDYHNLIDMPEWSSSYCHKHLSQLEDISMLAFFCVLIPSTVIDKVGLLDEQFDIGMFEDNDYNQRIRAAGFKIKLAKDAFVHHWQCASFKLLGKDTYLNIFNENKKKYQSKWVRALLTNDDAKKLSQLIAASENSLRTIIFAPSIGWNVHLFQRPHHLARIFAQNGNTVIFDCSNSSDDVDLIKEIEPNLFLFKGQTELINNLPRSLVWTFTYNYAYRDYFPGSTPVVYDWIDDLSVFPFDQTKLLNLHNRAIKEADVIAVVARNLLNEALIDRSDSIYLPNAVDEAHFHTCPDPNPALQDTNFLKLISEKCSIAGYYGALAEWFDYDLITSVAKLKPDWHFVLIGPDYDGSINKSPIKYFNNITWLGPRNYQILPGYLHLFDVAMIPFKINEITEATSPLKLFEYFAASKPVVTTPMPECKAFKEVWIADNSQDFADMLDSARKTAKDPIFINQLKKLVSENTWKSRTNKILHVLKEKSL